MTTDRTQPSPIQPAQAHRPTRRTAARRFAVLPIAAAVLALSACNINVDFDEESISQSFEVDRFDSISIEAPFEVTIRQGDAQSIDIELGESLQDDLIVEVTDGELRIDVESHNFMFSNDLIATITVIDLEALQLSSASDAVLANVDIDDLAVKTDEASQVRISGTIERLDLDMSGASQAELNGTTVQKVTLEMSGASSAEFPGTIIEITGSISGASSLDVDEATNLRVDSSGASNIDRK